MPKKLRFSVVFTSGEDEKYPSTELNTHGPTIRGWQSEKGCTYPQEIILKLASTATLHRIQVLAHQYLIPEKLELWVSDVPESLESDLRSQKFDYLGYIVLSDNQSTGFKSRELKSVSVPPCIGNHLKLRLTKNHENIYNIHNQVSLIAINIMGQEIETTPNNNSGNVNTNNPQYTSPYDDLAFEMYVDPDVATIIREMEAKKYQAVSEERFEYARKLKSIMEQLREVGERLGKYELEKRHAIDVEDYERASRKKNQADVYRKNAYQQMEVTRLLEPNGPDPMNDEFTDTTDSTVVPSKAPCDIGGLTSPPPLLNVPTGSDRAPVATRETSPASFTTTPYHGHTSPLHNVNTSGCPRSPPSGESPTNNNLSGCTSNSSGSGGFCNRTGSFRRRNKSAGSANKSSYEAYEERALPALRHSHTNEFLRECHLQQETSATSGEMKPGSRLNERERKQAALPILVFGIELVEKFYAKHFSDKEDGLTQLKEELRTWGSSEQKQSNSSTGLLVRHSANKTARAAVLLLLRALRDKVFSVYSLATEVIRFFFSEFVPDRVSEAESSRSVERLLPELLARSGDPVARVHTLAQHTALSVASCANRVPALRAVGAMLARPLASTERHRLALSRAQMVEQLVEAQGISTDKHSGLTCRTLSEFGASGLHHPAEPVRKVAERILVIVYKINPRLVRKQLPPDDDITRRNLLYRHLFHEFDKIDTQRRTLVQQTSVNSTHPDCVSPEQNLTKSKSTTSVSISYLNQEMNKVDVSDVQHVEIKKTRNTSETVKSQLHTQYSQQFRTILNEEIKSTNSSPIPQSKSSINIDSNQFQDDFDLPEEFLQTNRSSGKRNSTPSTSGVSSPSDLSQYGGGGTGDKQCIFCHTSASHRLFTDEQLNSHYWRSCPMLVRCYDCGQVTEIAGLTMHRLAECAKSSEYRQCRRCREAVPLMIYLKHVADMQCIEAIAGFNKCPLCHENIPQSDMCWKEHLMSENACKKNPRNKNIIVRAKSAAK